MVSEGKLRAARMATEARVAKHLEKISSATPDCIPIGTATRSVARKSKRFETIEDYVSIVRERGWTASDFSTDGYSCKQIVFFNWMLDGKCPISKDDFIREYTVNFMSLSEISKKYSIPYDHIGHLRDYYGIGRIGAKGLERGKKTIPLSSFQRSVVVGVLLGDAHIDSGGSLRIKHGDPQKDYSDHLHFVFAEHCKCGVESSTTYDDRHDKTFSSHCMRTMNHREFHGFRNAMYRNGEKVITDQYLDMIDDVALAYWLMDDGYVRFRDDFEPKEIRLYSCSFSMDDNLKLSDFLMRRYGFDFSLGSKSDGKNYFLMGAGRTASLFISAVRPHIIDSMMYKIDGRISRKEIPAFEKMPTKSKYKALPEKDRWALVSDVVEHYYETGFPYVRLSEDQIIMSVRRIRNWSSSHLISADGALKCNVMSSNIIWHHQPHMFSMATRGSMTPVDIFSDPASFSDAIDRRLKYGGTCTESGVRSALKEYKNNRSVGSYLPSNAKAVMHLLKADENTAVLDFCAGFGGRLLGCCGAGIRRYVGIDPLLDNCNGLNRMASYFPGTDVHIVNAPAEDCLPDMEDEFDIVFTSPPYFDKEIYSDQCTQSYVKHPDYTEWLTGWLLPVCRMSMEKLKKGGRFAISIGKSDDHNVASDFLSFFGTPDLVIPVETPVISYLRKNGAKKYEYVYVYEKK